LSYCQKFVIDQVSCSDRLHVIAGYFYLCSLYQCFHATVTLQEYSKVSVMFPLSRFGTMCVPGGMLNFKSFF
jgi:hypothetical protein